MRPPLPNGCGSPGPANIFATGGSERVSMASRPLAIRNALAPTDHAKGASRTSAMCPGEGQQNFDSLASDDCQSPQIALLSAGAIANRAHARTPRVALRCAAWALPRARVKRSRQAGLRRPNSRRPCALRLRCLPFPRRHTRAELNSVVKRFRASGSKVRLHVEVSGANRPVMDVTHVGKHTLASASSTPLKMTACRNPVPERISET